MPENSPGHGKRMIVATNDPMAPYWIQQCCKQQGIFHGIQWISNTDELLAELKKSNADAAFVDMDFIGEKLMRFLNDLALSEVDVPIILVSSCEPRIFHAVADYARSLALQNGKRGAGQRGFPAAYPGADQDGGSTQDDLADPEGKVDECFAQRRNRCPFSTLASCRLGQDHRGGSLGPVAYFGHGTVATCCVHEGHRRPWIDA